MGTHEDELAGLFEEDARLVRQARGLADVFVASAGVFGANWIETKVREVVTVEHEHTAQLGAKLSELKADLAVAMDEAPGATKAALAMLPWAWRRARDDVKEQPGPAVTLRSPLARTSPRLPSSLDEPLRRVLGVAGRLLSAYGYEAGVKEFGRQGNDWRYAYGLDLSNETAEALRAAAEADSKVMQHRQRLAVFLREMGEAAAGSAWDSA